MRPILSPTHTLCLAICLLSQQQAELHCCIVPHACTSFRKTTFFFLSQRPLQPPSLPIGKGREERREREKKKKENQDSDCFRGITAYVPLLPAQHVCTVHMSESFRPCMIKDLHTYIDDLENKSSASNIFKFLVSNSYRSKL